MFIHVFISEIAPYNPIRLVRVIHAILAIHAIIFILLFLCFGQNSIFPWLFFSLTFRNFRECQIRKISLIGSKSVDPPLNGRKNKNVRK